MMTDPSLAAMVPVDVYIAHEKKKWERMPFDPLMSRLAEKTGERLLQADRLATRLRAGEDERPKDARFLSVGRLSPLAYPLWGPEPEDYQLRRVVGELLAQKSVALVRTGRGDSAAECVRQAIGIAEELVRGDGYFVCPPCSWPARWSIVAEQLPRQEPCYL